MRVSTALGIVQVALNSSKVFKAERRMPDVSTMRLSEARAIVGPSGSAEVDILAQALVKAREFFT
jgi:hypothetical protein